MILFWEIFFYAIPIFVFLLIPFMTFYYEADDGMLMAGSKIQTTKKSKLREAICYELGIIIVFGALLFAGYLYFGKAQVPIQAYTGQLPDSNDVSITPFTGNNTFTTSSLAPMDTTLNQYSIYASLTRDMQDIIVPVNIPTFFAGFMSFSGWFFFALFGGIGLAALPLDLILAWVHRPRHLDPSEFADAQRLIRDRVDELVTIGEGIKLERDDRRNHNNANSRGLLSGLSKEARNERNTFLEFKKAVFLLDEDAEELKACAANYEGYNPLMPWLSLFGGILAFVISIAWIVHISIFMLPVKPIHPLLNSFFIWFDQWFPLFGILSVAIFTLYLLLAAVKGCFKFGLRFLFFEIHPMKLNKTYMSSFMFNVGLILLCALPVVQFCVAAFKYYARYTNISQVMGTQVYYLRFFTWFWTRNIFVFALLVITGLTCLYLFCKPRDRTGLDSKGLKERMQVRRR